MPKCALLCLWTLLCAFLTLPFLSRDLFLLRRLLRSLRLVEEREPSATDVGTPAIPAIPAIPAVAPETWPESLPATQLDRSCEISSRSLDWGWEEVCNLTKYGDEACEMFLASKMFQDERIFIETARRSNDRTYHPNLARLKARVVQAVSEGRPVKIVGLGPSTTKGLGCPKESLRWTDSLQNLSSFKGSPLRLEVFNENRPGTELHTQWQTVLKNYERQTVDIVVIDYSITAEHFNTAKSTVGVVYSGLQSWRRPPAILFIETFSLAIMRLWMEAWPHSINPCEFSSANFDSSDPFYQAAKAMQLPLLSYPDVVCHMPALNRSTRSINKMSFLHAYDDIGKNPPSHYGCGVHFILAHILHLYLLQILRESCDVGSKVCTGTLKESCDKGFQKTLEEEKMQPDLVLNLSKVERCEMHISTYLAEEIPAGFPAFVAQGDNVSRWKLGADRPSKFGWIANEEPRYWKKRRKSEHWPELSQYGRYAQLLPGEIVFLIQLREGVVFVDYLSSYSNIGTATCQLEDMEQKPLGPEVKIDALWSQKMSITTRVTLEAERVPDHRKLGRGFNAAVRCKEDGQKFKLISISSC